MQSAMKLATTIDGHIDSMMDWFLDRRSCAIWAGPDFRYPFTAETFREDMRLSLPSYSLVIDTDEFVAFGQYYARLQRCHLARLAVAPNHRGHGIGHILIRELSRVGRKSVGASECSLFVMDDNTPARRLYEHMGFVTTPYLGGDIREVPGMLYMVASHEAADGWERLQT